MTCALLHATNINQHVTFAHSKPGRTRAVLQFERESEVHDAPNISCNGISKRLHRCELLNADELVANCRNRGRAQLITQKHVKLQVFNLCLSPCMYKENVCLCLCPLERTVRPQAATVMLPVACLRANAASACLRQHTQARASAGQHYCGLLITKHMFADCAAEQLRARHFPVFLSALLFLLRLAIFGFVATATCQSLGDRNDWNILQCCRLGRGALQSLNRIHCCD